MKKRSTLTFIFIFFILSGNIFSAFSTWKDYFFPECGMSIKGPEKWFTRNESQRGFGYVLITKEKVEFDDDIYFTGIAIYTNLGKMFEREFKDENEIILEIMRPRGKNPPDKIFTNPFILKTSLGNFSAYETLSKNEIQTHAVNAVLRNGDSSYWLYYESPGSEWKSSRPILEKIVSSIVLGEFPRSKDRVVASIYSK